MSELNVVRLIEEGNVPTDIQTNEVEIPVDDVKNDINEDVVQPISEPSPNVSSIVVGMETVPDITEEINVSQLDSHQPQVVDSENQNKSEPSDNPSELNSNEEIKSPDEIANHSRELKSLLALSKEANLDTNISQKRKSVSARKSSGRISSGKTSKIKYPVTAESELEMDLPMEEVKSEPQETDQPRSLKRKKSVSIEGNNSDEPLKKNYKSYTPPEVEVFKPNKDMFCWRCHKEGVNIACETCPRSYHIRCLKRSIADPEHWPCPECVSISNAQNPQNRSPAMRGMTLEHLCSLLKFAVNRMIECYGSKPFRNEVNDNEFPDYKKYIIQPMNLKLLEKNIKENVYGSTQAFEADAKWILHNSIIFNSYQSKLTSAAKNIIKICKQEMAEIENCPTCYLNANTKKNTWFVEVCPKPHLLVWAKLRGFPYWPGKAMSCKEGQVDVRFFGAHDRAWVPEKECFLYTPKDPNLFRVKRADIENCVEELELHVENLKKTYGEFNYPPFKTQIDPDHEVKQLQIFVPTYKSAATKKKRVKSIDNREPLKGPAINSSAKGEQVTSDQMNEEIEAKNCSTFDDSMEGYGTDDESIPELDTETRKNLFNKPENGKRYDTGEADEDDTQVPTNIPPDSGGLVLTKGDKTKLRKCESDTAMKLHEEVTPNKKISRRSSDTKSECPKVSDKINRVDILDTEIRLGNSEENTEKHLAVETEKAEDFSVELKKKPVQVDVHNVEFTISPASKLKMSGQLQKMVNVDNLSLIRKNLDAGSPLSNEKDEFSSKTTTSGDVDISKKIAENDAGTSSCEQDRSGENDKVDIPQSHVVEKADEQTKSKSVPKHKGKGESKAEKSKHLTINASEDSTSSENTRRKSNETLDHSSKVEKETSATTNSVSKKKKRISDRYESGENTVIGTDSNANKTKKTASLNATLNNIKPSDKAVKVSNQSDLIHSNIQSDSRKRRPSSELVSKERTESQAKIQRIVESPARNREKTPITARKKSGNTTSTKSPRQSIEIVVERIKSEPESESEPPIDIEAKKKYLSALNIGEKGEVTNQKSKPNEIRTRSKTEEKRERSKGPKDPLALDNMTNIIDEGVLSLSPDESSQSKKTASVTRSDGTKIMVKSFAAIKNTSEIIEKSALQQLSRQRTRKSLPQSHQNKTDAASTNKDASRPTSVNSSTLKTHPEMSSLPKITVRTSMAPTIVGPSASISTPVTQPDIRAVPVSVPQFGGMPPTNGYIILQSQHNIQDNMATVLIPPSQTISYNSSMGANQMVPISSCLIPAPTTNSISVTNEKQSELPLNTNNSQNYIPQGEAGRVTPINNSGRPNLTRNLPNSTVVQSEENRVTPLNVDPILISDSRQESDTGTTNLSDVRGLVQQVMKKPPKLRPKPIGILSQNFNEGISSTAGPVAAKINSVGHKFADFFKGLLVETVSDLGKSDNSEAAITNLKLEMENLKHEHKMQIAEIERNVTTTMRDLLNTVAEEREKAMEEARVSTQVENARKIQETKMRQWCANCFKEAAFYCCWNTSYCDYPCQQMHWPQHMNLCTQNNQTTQLRPVQGQPLILRPANPPPRGAIGPKVIGKPMPKVYMNRCNVTAPKTVRVQTSAGSLLTMMETTPGHYQLMTTNALMKSGNPPLRAGTISGPPIPIAPTPPQKSSNKSSSMRFVGNMPVTTVLGEDSD